MLKQFTINKPISITGIGLHSGTKVKLTLQPAPPNTGITFKRVDLNNSEVIKASPFAVGDTRMASTLHLNDTRISTVEHLLSACAALSIANLAIEVSAEEIPIMDGSAVPFLMLLKEAGIREQSESRKFLRVLREVAIVEPTSTGEKWAKLAPYDGFSLDFSIGFDHPYIDATPQTVRVDFNKDSFSEKIARARTFGFMRDVETLRGMGLARGGSFENAMVLNEYTLLNDTGLRLNDEFASHKILDAIGDLYLVGYPLLAAYTAHKAGHDLNNKLLRVLLSDTSSFELVELPLAQAPLSYSKVIEKEWLYL